MQNIHLVTQPKYSDSTKFEKVADGIYKALYMYDNELVEPGHYVVTISFTLEEALNETKNRQYPLEDILDKYLAHVTEFIQDDQNNPVMILELCTQNWLPEMLELIKICGKHIYNRKIIEAGNSYDELVIE